MSYNQLAERKALNAIDNNQNQDALSILMNTYGDEIYGFCNTMLNNTADAEDALQTSFVQAFRSFSSFNGESTLRTWLYSIARNRCLDQLKAQQRLSRRIEFVDEIAEQATDDSQELDLAADHLGSSILKRCLSKLSNSVREATLMRYQLGLSYQEAASITGDKAGTLQARVARALPTLRRCVEESGLTL